jgi:hypothetical protein
MAIPPNRLAPAQLAFEESAPVQLVAAGAIERAADGTHQRGDIARIRIAQALASGGIGVDDLMHHVRTGRMPHRDIALRDHVAGHRSHIPRVWLEALARRWRAGSRARPRRRTGPA